MVYRDIKLIIIVSIAILFSPLISESATPRLINFQGRLTDQQGNPLEGTYNLKFNIYSSSDLSASPLWTEEHLNVSASKGIINVLLGSIRSFDEPIKITFDQERYLGIAIDCDHDPNTKEPEITPRQRILPAIHANDADFAYIADTAGNADKLDGKDSSDFTTSEKDAGRPGVVENLYEGNIRLIDKYIKADSIDNIIRAEDNYIKIGDTIIYYGRFSWASGGSYYYSQCFPICFKNSEYSTTWNIEHSTGGSVWIDEKTFRCVTFRRTHPDYS